MWMEIFPVLVPCFKNIFLETKNKTLFRETVFSHEDHYLRGWLAGCLAWLVSSLWLVPVRWWLSESGCSGMPAHPDDCLAGPLLGCGVPLGVQVSVFMVKSAPMPGAADNNYIITAKRLTKNTFLLKFLRQLEGKNGPFKNNTSGCCDVQYIQSWIQFSQTH